jgi:hypothetical protein
MPASEMLHRVVLAKTDISEKFIASIIRVTRVDDLEETLAVSSKRRTLQMDFYLGDFCHPGERCDTFLRNVSSHNIHTARHPRRRRENVKSYVNNVISYD